VRTTLSRVKTLGKAARRAAVAASMGWLAACSSLESTAWNVRQLHEDDGSPRPVAAVMTGIEYSLRSSIGGLPGLGDAAAGPEDKPVGRVSSPRRRALSELLELEEHSVRDFDARCLQAELASWLATSADPTVERLVAVRVAGKVASELGDVAPVANRETEVVKHSGDDLLALVRELSTSARANDAARIAQLVGPFEPRTLELDAARRLLRACALLSHEADGRAADALRRASDGYARRCVELALGVALADPQRDVRAEAHRHVALLEPDAAFALAESAAERSDFAALEEVLRALLIAGLPSAAAGDDAQDDSLAGWLALFVAHVDSDLSPQFVGGLPAAAARCLERFSGSGRSGLRPEDWRAWYATRSGAAERTNDPSVDESANATDGAGS
jgi:hypothetical protein